jgi:pyruvate dehydrogenase (quinone)
LVSNCLEDERLVNGLYDGYRVGNPLIAAASNIFKEKLGPDNFQKTGPEYLFQDSSKYLFKTNTPKQTMNGLQTVIQHAISQKGMAVLDLPRM